MFGKKFFAIICAATLFVCALAPVHAIDQAMGPSKVQKITLFEAAHPWGDYALISLESGDLCNAQSEYVINMQDANARNLLSLLTAAKFAAANVTITVNDAVHAPGGQCQIRFIAVE